MTTVIPSYLAKVNRAEKHLMDLQAEIDRYAASQPYAVTYSIEGNDQHETFRLRFTSPANTDIPVIAADAINNLRASLEHLMGALVPKKERTHVAFPILFQGVWEPSVPGESLERCNARKRWTRIVASVHPCAVAILKEMQPSDTTGDEGRFHRLAVLKRLSDRDRHEKLPVVALGLRDAYMRNVFADGTWQDGVASPNPNGFFENGAVVEGIPDGVVDVKVTGTPVVVIRTGQKGRDIPIPEQLSPYIGALRDTLFPRLAPYVHADAGT
jgi:hypothetical protein